MRGLPALLCLGLAGCGPSYVTRDQASDIAHEEMAPQVSNLSDRIDALEKKNAGLENRVQSTEARLGELDGKAAALDSSISQTSAALSRASRIADENAVKDMTRRGACGMEYYETANGGTAMRNRECKLTDLVPEK